MRRLFLTIGFLSLLILKGQSQCSNNNFILPDSVCPGLPVTIDNSLSTAQSWNWDYNLGDLDSLPTVSGITGGGSLNFPQHMKVVKENGNYYGFVPNGGADYITRYDFGNSPANVPVITNLTSDPVFNGFASGIDLVKEGNKWIGFVCMYSNGKLAKLEFDSITQVSPIVTNLGNLNTFGPAAIKIIGDYMFITNQLSDISRYSFGGNYNNLPNPLLPNINSGYFNNSGIDIQWDCNSGKYIGIIGAYSANLLLKLDFGNDLSNQPIITTVATISKPQGVQMVKEGNSWHLFTVTENNQLFHYTFGSSLDNPLVYSYDSNFGGSFSDPKNIQMVRVGSDWFGLIPNNLLFALRLLTFPQGGFLSPNSSAVQSPSNLIYPGTYTGFHFIELTETDVNGLETSFYDSTLVTILPPKAIFVSSAACQNNSINFSDQSSVCFGNLTGWKWDFGDSFSSNQQNPIHTYTSSGNYNVSLTVYTSTNDSNTTVQNIFVSPLPTSLYTVTDSICAGSAVIFTDQSTTAVGTINSWQWKFGDNQVDSISNTSHIYINDGNYISTLIVTASTGCIDSISKLITIKSVPHSYFNVTNTCLGDSANFINSSTITTGTIVSSFWEFGDSNTSILQSPKHYYGITAGNFDVSLVSIAANGCTDTASQNIRIGNKPNAWFTLSLDTACARNSITFSDSSYIAIGDSITSRYWDFGDGNIDSISINPIHSYQNPGNYNIMLTVSSPTDCHTSVIRSIFVIDSPIANFITTNVCINSSTQFTDLSTSPLGSSITSWNWNFGDSLNSAIQNPTHTYLSAGTYPVTLQIISSKGCTDTASFNAIVYSQPIAYFGFEKACTGKSVQFNDSSSVNNSTINNWNWNFGISGATSNIQNPTYNFINNSVYPITLIATSAFGCSDTTTRYIVVDQSPLFNLQTSNNCYGITTHFNFIPLAGAGNLIPEWSFGDGTFSNLANPTHIYVSTGNYQITLVVTDLTNGCSSTKDSTVQIYEKPIANFLTDSGCVNQSLQLQDLSNVSVGNITNWNWNFGIHGSSNLQNPIISTAVADSFPVKLLVITNNGCKDSIIHFVETYPLPIVSFNPNPNYGAPPMNVTFQNNSSVANYNWNFGDGSLQSVQSQPQHLYTDTGNYNITLTATTNRGCIDSLTKSVIVFSPYIDLGIEAVNFTLDNGLWVITAKMRNNGNQNISNYSVLIRLDGKSIINEAFNDIFPINTVRNITFKTRFKSKKNDNPGYLCLTITDVDGTLDDNELNDEKCVTVSSSFEIFETYPNPFLNDITIGFNLPEKADVEISLLDINGTLVKNRQTQNYLKGYNSINLNYNNISSGIYFIELKYKDASIRKKIIRL